MQFIDKYFRLLLLLVLTALTFVLYGYSQNGRYRRVGSIIIDTRTGETKRW